MSDKRSGYVALIGRPNVGKSTLLNHLLGEKLSITSRKPQTTRHKLLGVKTLPDAQIIYVDTPGIHQKMPRKLNRYMNKAALQALQDVDVVIFMVDALSFNDADEWVLKKLQNIAVPVLLAVNKVDTLHRKDELLPHLQMLAEQYDFAEVVPISARTGYNLQQLETCILQRLPKTDFYYFPEDQLTDRSERFLTSEVIREKVMRGLGQELPYATSIEIESFDKQADLLTIQAVIWVERDSQKPIVIGKKGARLKTIGTQARIALERLFKGKVMLKLWVKVLENWSDNVRALHSLGYSETDEN